MTAAEYLLAHPELRHGKIRIGFTPDEEIGRGVDFFDVKAFGADFAYTMDGGFEGNSNTRTSTPRAPRSRSRAATSTRATPKTR